MNKWLKRLRRLNGPPVMPESTLQDSEIEGRRKLVNEIAEFVDSDLRGS